MAYRLDPARPLGDSIREVAREQIAGAHESLKRADADLEQAVHDMRKRCKKLRALLRLVRPGLGKTYADENAAFRDLARPLSAVRDAQVLVETIGRLEERAETAGAPKVLAPVRDWAARRHEAAQRDSAIAERIDAARAALERARKRAAGWQLDDPDAALAGGLRRSYARARTGWREAIATDAPEPMHGWRKRVKDHWYHCRLLRAAWPKAMKLRVAALDQLGDELGTAHDLAVLLATLRDEAGALPPETAGAVAALARARSAELREEALRRAPQLFVETPKALSRRLTGQWSLAAA